METKQIEVMVNGEAVLYTKAELGYQIGKRKKYLTIFTSDPSRVDMMINELVANKAEKLAKQELIKLIAEKVANFLGDTNTPQGN